MDSELLSVVTDLQDSALLMIANNTWLSTNQTSDWEVSASYQKETQKEKLRKNLKEKLKNQEVLKREKFLPQEKYKPELTSEELKKTSSENLSHDSVYRPITLHFIFYLNL